jgi:hypothetical protein
MMKHFFKNIVNPFRRTFIEVPWFGPAVSTVLVAALINVLTTTLTSTEDTTPGWLFVLFLFVIALVFVFANAMNHRRWVRNLGPVNDIPRPGKYEGLVFLFNREETLRAAIDHHREALKRCWLIVTPEMQAKLGSVMTHFPEVQFSVQPISNLYSTQECYETVRRIYKEEAPQAGIQFENVISDITGGTKPMTMGMIIACLEGGYPVEHIPTKFDSSGSPTIPLPPIEIRVNKI